MPRRYLTDSTGKEYLAYVPPGDMGFDPEFVSFLFPWLLAMREGVGPKEPSDGYVGGSRAGRSDRAHYEAWCKVAAEFDRRLEHTHEDRLIAEKYLQYLEDYSKELLRADTLDEYNDWIRLIAKDINREPRKVVRDLNSVLSYIASGPCPRWLNCIDCLEYQRCRKKKKDKAPRGVTYEEWKGKRRKK